MSYGGIAIQPGTQVGKQLVMIPPVSVGYWWSENKEGMDLSPGHYGEGWNKAWHFGGFAQSFNKYLFWDWVRGRMGPGPRSSSWQGVDIRHRCYEGMLRGEHGWEW